MQRRTKWRKEAGNKTRQGSERIREIGKQARRGRSTGEKGIKKGAKKKKDGRGWDGRVEDMERKSTRKGVRGGEKKRKGKGVKS